MLSAYVEGVGVWGPGLEGWTKARDVLRGTIPYEGVASALPTVELLPPAERRRVGPTVKLALTVGQEAVGAAGADRTQLATVFASSGGDGETIHNILKTLATPQREVSPTRFHNSVHNAPSGYWALAVQSRAPSTTVSAHDRSFAAGLIEAMAYLAAEEGTVMLVAYDQAYPEPLHAARPLTAAFGAALVLTRHATPRAQAHLSMRLAGGVVHESAMADRALDALRLGNPAARSLPLLQALALARPGTTVLTGAGADHLVIACDGHHAAVA